MMLPETHDLPEPLPGTERPPMPQGAGAQLSARLPTNRIQRDVIALIYDIFLP